MIGKSKSTPSAGTSGLIGTFRVLCQLFSPTERRRFAWLLFVLLGASALEILSLALVPLFVATLSVQDAATTNILGGLVDSIMSALSADPVIVYSVFLLAAFVLKGTYLLFAIRAQASFIEQLRCRIGHDLFASYLKAPYSFHLAANSAILIRNSTQELDRLVSGVVSPAINLLLQAAIGAAVLVFLLVSYPEITLAAAGIFGLASFLVLRYLRERAVAFGKQAQSERGAQVRIVRESLKGYREIRLCGQEGFFGGQYDQSVERLSRAMRHQFMSTKLLTPILEIVAVIGMLAVIWIALLGVASPSTLMPTLALFAVALFRLRQSLTQVVSAINRLRYEFPAVEAIHGQLAKGPISQNQLPESSTRGGAVKVFEELIEVEDLTFRYPGAGADAVQGLNFRIAKGAAIGLVGATGSGKSTVLAVLLGLLRPTTGDVLVDGTSVFQDIPGWQSLLGYVPQAGFLLDASILDNITLGRSLDEADKRLKETLRLARLEEFLKGLPDGVRTNVGDAGSSMSGGQQQRICIARSLYANPEILILDEATSALDAATERGIVDGLIRNRDGRTVILVAHRPECIRACDSLIYLRRGRIEQIGEFGELFHSNSRFRDECTSGEAG